MKPNPATYPTGKELISELEGKANRGIWLFTPRFKDQWWESIRYHVPPSVVSRGRPAVIRWLYELVRDHHDHYADGRRNCSHDKAITFLLHHIVEPSADLSPKVGDLIDTIKTRKYAKSGKRGGSQKKT